jgi:hypothetical protein
MTFWQTMYLVGTLTGLGMLLWAMMNLPFTKNDIRKWISKVKTEILPEQKRMRKEIYDRLMKKLYPEYCEMKRKGEIS